MQFRDNATSAQHDVEDGAGEVVDDDVTFKVLPFKIRACVYRRRFQLLA